MMADLIGWTVRMSVGEVGGRECGGDRMERWREGCGSTYEVDLGI